MKFRYQRWMLRAAVVYFLVGVLLGLLMYLGQGVPGLAWTYRLYTTHVHILLVGSVMQTIMAVALWMFPRRKEPPYWTPESQGLLLFWIFNLGVVLRSVTEPLAQDHPALFWASVAGVLLEITGFFYFAYLVLQRIRAPGSRRTAGKA